MTTGQTAAGNPLTPAKPHIYRPQNDTNPKESEHPMKASALQSNLSKALAIVGRAVASRATLPVTQNVLMSTEDGMLRLSATNLEISITTKIPAMVEEEGATTIPARLLTEFINSLDGERVDMALDHGNQRIQIISGQAEANIAGTKAEDFPPIPRIEDAQVLTLDPQVMRTAISRTAFAAATEESRPVLTGVELKLLSNRFTMSAADGFRMAIQNGEISEGPADETAVIIPAKTMTEVHRLLSDSAESLEIAISPNRGHITFSTQGTDRIDLTSQLLQGTFPNTDQLIPDTHVTRAVVDAPNALRAVRTAAVFARDSSNIIRMEMQNPAGDEHPQPSIRISAQSEELGDEQQRIGIMDIEGEDNKIAFNSRYLVDIFSVLDKGHVAIETTTPSSPGVFKPTDGDDYIHVIMPMFVQW